MQLEIEALTGDISLCAKNAAESQLFSARNGYNAEAHGSSLSGWINSMTIAKALLQTRRHHPRQSR